MRTPNLAMATLMFALHASPAHAESLRCNGSSATEGDSKLSVLHKCGAPQLKDSYCASVYHPQSLEPVPEPFASTIVPCQAIEEWLYDRGPGNMLVTVRFRAGIVQSIRYARSPR